MTKAYDPVTAAHYSAFRPMLHRPILSRCIPKKNTFAVGLDIGCGTGQSSIVLAHFCKKVIGVDPSEDMLKRSIAHPQVEYRFGDVENLGFAENHFEIVTFAGSLYYAKSQKLLDEVVRICKPSAKIIVYDFEIVLAKIWHELGVHPNKKEDTSYNHQENFSGLQNEAIKCIASTSEELTFDIRASDLAHLILSEKNVYDSLSLRLGHKALYDQLKKQLVELSGGEDHQVKAHLFYSIYEGYKNS